MRKGEGEKEEGEGRKRVRGEGEGAGVERGLRERQEKIQRARGSGGRVDRETADRK